MMNFLLSILFTVYATTIFAQSLKTTKTDILKSNDAALTAITVQDGLNVTGTSVHTGNQTLTGNLTQVGNQTVTGNVAVTGRSTVTSTTLPSRPCPVMTTAQRNAASFAEGDCIYNSNTLTLNITNGAVWREVYANTYVTFSGRFTSGGVVTETSTLNYINGNCAVSGTSSNVRTCTLNTALAAVPTCVAAVNETPSAADLGCHYDSAASSTTQIVFWSAANAVLGARACSYVCHGEAL